MTHDRPSAASRPHTPDLAPFYDHPGSSHTAYIPPPTNSPFREPELVVDDAPALSQPRSWSPRPTWGDPTNDWGNFSNTWGDPAPPKIPIDGRDDGEELRWYDQAVQSRRPGPAILPPLLAQRLHDPDHALYSVITESHPPLATPPPPHAPTPDEVRTAIPHPHAYYCRQDNAWVLLFWCSSTVLPPLRVPISLPDQARRRQSNSCIADDQQPFGPANLTHHWHHYPKVVDATKLTTPYTHGDLLLDLYLCCQCSLYCLISDLIPGVIPRHLADLFVLDKMSHPALDKTPRATVVAAWETVFTIIDNRLWRDEKRSLPVTRPRFRTKLGWNHTVEQVFCHLGFPLEPAPQLEGNNTLPDLALQPPPIDPNTPEGKASRTKLLRAWVEISAWLVIYQKSKEGMGQYNPILLHVKADNGRDMYQTGIGAHVSQIARGQLPDPLVGYASLDNSWEQLGMTPSTYSPELLAFAYLAQCRCDPARTMVYFTHFSNIVSTMLTLGVHVPNELQSLIVQERERFRFTVEDYANAARTLGFGLNDGDLGLDLDSDVDDEFIARAWRSARQRSWQKADASTRRARLNEALHIVAQQRASEGLMKIWSEEKGTGMSPETACSTLDVPIDVDEGMLLTVFGMRIDDQPSQSERMREALSVIAEVRDSDRLRHFLSTGNDPGDGVLSTTSPDMPRGLNQLGNTCYLNSLLQYFYTIKELRVAIVALANANPKSLDDSKFTDDDLKRHRVGGRLVTRREVLRSKKFVHLLADLFANLKFSETPAVTPALELAKLALVTSQDEEEDETDKAATDSSNDTDATLVDDMAPRLSFERSSPQPVQSPRSPSGSVLGKRSRHTESQMDLDTPLRVTSPIQGQDATVLIEEAIASSSKRPMSGSAGTGGPGLDVEMKDETDASRTQAPPPLPPRKGRTTDDSVMMFGRQHDVSECMDNCMFQIETALLDFQGVSDDDKTSPVKRLFYGKKRQRLIALSSTDGPRQPTSVHEKEDLFSHLHVNVADEGFDIYDGLARYFDDVVEVGGERKRMEVSLVDPPPLLQIQLQRVQFNRETQQAYKSQAYVKFTETIYMDRFLDSADPEKKTRSKAIQTELNAARDRVQRLTQGKHAPFASALNNVSIFLEKQTQLEIPPDDSSFLVLRNESTRIKDQLQTERARTVELKQQLEDVWKEDVSAAYDLTSVFIHRGSSPSWGHYFFYSRNLPDKPDAWFKYNDSDVTAVAKEEVLADTTGSTANPYMLVFVRKDIDAIDTVHRFGCDDLMEEE